MTHKVPRDSHLGACIAELGESGVEEAILLPEWLNIGSGMRFFCLERHVGVRDLGDRRAAEGVSNVAHVEGWQRSQIKHDRQSEHKHSNGEVHPLHGLQRADIILRIGEENIAAQHRRHDRPNPVEGLREIDPQLRIPRRTADGDVRVGSRFERPQSVADDENGSAEAAERSMQNAGPSDQGTDPV